ncbi:MAG: bifunctional folylpolyglutamate synthase/dihydrofolate synthase [Bacteroidales bacterium]|nr:bifunctional folylpolyglutamate synthase/dihydrofolate synthase [Bacteroidales bacterium]
MEFLYSQLPVYQRIGQAAYKVDLDNTVALCKLLGNPERKIKTIHIAGTNGKGSVAHFIASVFQEAGFKTGLYTSPHLKDFRERIKINGKKIGISYVNNFVKKHRKDFLNFNLSFFEMTVGLAFDYFVTHKVDIAIIETGLGGRLDSTNVINPELSVITNIAFDHMSLLGNSLEQIAYEKAGIIKSGTPAVIGQKQKNTDEIFNEKARTTQSSIYFAEEFFSIESFKPSFKNKNSDFYLIRNLKNQSLIKLEIPLRGHYQRHNIITVLKSLDVITEIGYEISEEDIIKGIKNIVKNTGLQGRWQILSKKPYTVCDTAHNEAGINEIIGQLRKISYDKLHIVLGMVNDKDIKNILKLLPSNAVYYFSRPDIPRGLDPNILQKEAKVFNLTGDVYSSVKAAYDEARKKASPKDLIYIGGSTFVVAEVV